MGERNNNLISSPEPRTQKNVSIDEEKSSRTSSNHEKCNPLIPTITEINALLGSTLTPLSLSLLEKNLLSPIDEFLATGGKKLRVEVIELGFLAAGGVPNERQQTQLHQCSQIIEGLHAGSMIIDDIQDQSLTRRNQPTLHERYGVAVALNAGNWLYFQAIHQMKSLNLKPTQETHLKHYVNEIILKAHFGQALDVGTPISSLPQAGVKPTCLTAMELKTGALMALAFDLGAFIADQRPLPSVLGRSLGNRFGIALQMFDDIGNFLLPPPKGKEDLLKNRPSFIWAMAASIASEEEYLEFLRSVRALPDPQFIEKWAAEFQLVERSKKEASHFLWSILRELKLRPDLEKRIKNLFQKLESAYG